MPKRNRKLVNNIAVFCADVGSIKQNKFGWAASYPDGTNPSGSSIEEFAKRISEQIQASKKVAIGFECPLFVPVRTDPVSVNSARNGEGNRSWSAGAGTGALATGLVEVLWVMNAVSRILGKSPKASFSWLDFMRTNSVFLWEAFVTSEAKGSGHAHDAKIAVSHFNKSMPNPEGNNAIQEPEVFSLIGAAALRAGWANNVNVLSEQCLVIKA